MKSKLLLFILFLYLIHPMMGCGNKSENSNPFLNPFLFPPTSSGLPFGAGGSGGSTPNATEQQLTGDWISDATTGDGEKVILNFNFSGGERLTTAKTLQVTGLTSIVSSGFYEVKDNNLILKLTLTTYQAAMILKTNPDELWIGSERYTRFAVLDAPSISGQIHVAEEELNAMVEVSSTPYTIDQVFVKYKKSSKAALKLSGAAPSSYHTIEINYDDLEEGQFAQPLNSTGPQALTLDRRPLVERIGNEVRRRELVKERYEETIKALESDPNVESVTKNYLLRAQAEDPLYAQQQKSDLDKIQMEAAWQLIIDKGNANPQEVVVAVIDGGIRADHPDLSGRIVTDSNNKVVGYDFVPDSVMLDDGSIFDDGTTNTNNFGLDGDGEDTDPTDPGDGWKLSESVDGNSWHGTHVAGVIAAVKDNGQGIKGVADKVKILPIRALGKTVCKKGSDGKPVKCTVSGPQDSLIKAIQYAAKIGAFEKADHPDVKIINLSLGFEATKVEAVPILDAIEAAVAKGILVIAAAGNDGLEYDANAQKSFYPAAAEHVLAVGALGSSGSWATFSNSGPFVDVVAPGQSIYGTIWDKIANKAAYGPRTGTSQATPLVSGLAALMLSQKPDLTPAQVIAKIKENVAVQSDVVAKTSPGKGLIKAHNTLASLLEVSLPFNELKILGSNVNFGPYGSLGKVLLDNIGAPVTDLAWTVSTTSVPEGAKEKNWFSVTLDADNGKTINKSASLQFEVHRKGLPVGTYKGEVSLNSVAVKGATTVTVEMEVKEAIDVKGLLGVVGDLSEEEEDDGETDTDGDGISDDEDGFINFVDIGDLYVLLKDPVSKAIVTSYDKTSLASNYFFMIVNIPVGTYLLEAGLDTNKDGHICDLTVANPEPCTVYPDLIQIKAGTHIEDIVINF